ncbi:hypothetical protein [Candidatus Leptofilum sp.]|uniref:nSTAND1 domain-containing NTPase n=1 Tax=Candidatus Leptofilum sp. TaxID=3241576 RepID=UPI003B5AF031
MWLRSERGITQTDQAQIFGLTKKKSRDTIALWEKGKVIPPENKWRQLFISYLLDTLGLREDPAKFLEVWHVLESEWGWSQLDHDQDISLQPDIDQNPYRGLEAFTEADRYNFFGRDDQVDELEKAIQQQPLLILFGSSGSGKTSIIQAGLIPRLRQSEWTIVQMRPGRQPFQALIEGLLAVAYPNHSENGRRVKATQLVEKWLQDNLSLTKIVQTLPRFSSIKQLLVIVDQFEELFTTYPDSKLTKQFVSSLLSLLEKSGLSINLLFAIRADFLAETMELPHLAEKLNKHQYMLPAMSHEQLEAAILQPAYTLFTRFEEGLLSRILLDVGDSPGKLTLLEFALTKLWEHHANKSGLLTIAAYEAIGRVQGALINYAEAVFNDLDTTEQQQSARLFTQLVKPSKKHKTTRILASRTKLGTEKWALVAKLADARLIVTSKAETEQAEIIHETLIETWPRLVNWIEASRDFRIWQEDLGVLVAQWQKVKSDEGILLRGTLLETAVTQLKQRGDELSSQEREFITASIALRDKETAERDAQLQKEKRATYSLRRRAIYLALALFAVVILAIVTFNFGQRSNQEAQNARAELSNSLARQARTLYATQPRLALLLAAEAVRIPIEENDPRPVLAEEALREGLEQLYGYGLAGHEATITASAFSPDGRWYATASFDSTLRLFDLTAPAFSSTVLQGHAAPILNMAISPDGRWLASVSNDQTARLWDLHTANPVDHSVVLAGHQKIVGSVAFSPNGRWLATGSSDTTVYLWDLLAPDPAAIPTVLSGHQGSVNSIAFSPDSAWLATGGNDNQVRLWSLAADPATNFVVLYEHEDIVYKVAFSPDGRWLATASADGTVRLGEFAFEDTISSPFSLIHHDDEVFDLAFSPDNRWLATASADTTTVVWDLAQPDMVSTGIRLIAHTSSVQDVLFDSDSRWLISGSDDATVMVWELAAMSSNVQPIILRAHEDGVRTVAISPNGTWLASGAADGMSHIWEFASLKSHAPITFQHNFSGLLFTTFVQEDGQPDKFHLAVADVEGQVRLLPFIDAAPTDSFIALDGQQDAINVLVASENGRWLASGDVNGLIRLWQLNGGLSTFTLALAEHESAISSMHFSPDNRWLITADIAGTLHLWELATIRATPNPVASHQASGSIMALAISADGRWLASGGSDAHVYLWQLDTAQPLANPVALIGHDKQVNNLSFSANGRWLASGSDDHTARLWNVAAPNKETVLTGHERFLTSVVFSPDNQWLATTSADGFTYLWDVTATNPAASPQIVSGHTGAIQSAAFSPDSQFLVTTGIDQTARLWDLESDTVSETVTTLNAGAGNIIFATFSPDNQWLVTSGNDGVLKLWPLSLPYLIKVACQTAGRNLFENEWNTYLQNQPTRQTCLE